MFEARVGSLYPRFDADDVELSWTEKGKSENWKYFSCKVPIQPRSLLSPTTSARTPNSLPSIPTHPFSYPSILQLTPPLAYRFRDARRDIAASDHLISFVVVCSLYASLLISE